jgi:hypothetical protein
MVEPRLANRIRPPSFNVIEGNMSKRLTWLGVHLLLLALASTSFTIVTGLRDGRFNWEYFRYHSQSGWGIPYQFPYSVWVVLAYLAAYATGIAAYQMAYRSGSRIIGLAGLLFCATGLASFAFELTHWFVNHYRSWIASAPIALLALAAMAALQQYRQKSAEPVTAAQI